jgi:hypothetical protein
MIIPGRHTAAIDGDFAVFLIGMRINRFSRPDKWLPVAFAMPRMLTELYRQPEMGLLHAQTWFARTIIVVQYWRSVGQLLAYAKNRDALHLPAWRAFNKAVDRNASVGLWHETYVVTPGRHESVYVDMPPFGLGKAGSLVPATAGRHSATERLGDPDASNGTALRV